MKITLYSLTGCVLVLSFFGCKKDTQQADEHPIPIPANCALCAYADELEGSYVGMADGLDVRYHTDSVWVDSLRVSVEHIYQNLGTYEDSTVMFLRLRSHYRLQSDTTVRVIEMRSPTHFNYITDPGTFETFTLTPEKMEVHYFAQNFIGWRE